MHPDGCRCAACLTAGNIHPTAVVRDRDNPVSNFRQSMFNRHFSGKVTVPVDAETAPLPVPSTTFYGVGRAPDLGGVPFRQLVMETDINATLSHVYQGWAGNFLIPKNLRPNHLPGNPGEMVALRERVNIANPGNEAAGSRVSLTYDPMYSPHYAKVM